jgi:hypothetical protein
LRSVRVGILVVCLAIIICFVSIVRQLTSRRAFALLLSMRESFISYTETVTSWAETQRQLIRAREAEVRSVGRRR